MGMIALLYNQFRIRTFKMASFKTEIPLSELVDKTGSKCYRWNCVIGLEAAFLEFLVVLITFLRYLSALGIILAPPGLGVLLPHCILSFPLLTDY